MVSPEKMQNIFIWPFYRILFRCPCFLFINKTYFVNFVNLHTRVAAAYVLLFTVHTFQGPLLFGQNMVFIVQCESE